MAQAFCVSHNRQRHVPLHLRRIRIIAKASATGFDGPTHPGLRYIGGVRHGEPCQFRRVDARPRRWNDGGRSKDTASAARAARGSDINDQPGCGVGICLRNVRTASARLSQQTTRATLSVAEAVERASSRTPRWPEMAAGRRSWSETW